MVTVLRPLPVHGKLKLSCKNCMDFSCLLLGGFLKSISVENARQIQVINKVTSIPLKKLKPNLKGASVLRLFHNFPLKHN